MYFLLFVAYIAMFAHPTTFKHDIIEMEQTFHKPTSFIMRSFSIRYTILSSPFMIPFTSSVHSVSVASASFGCLNTTVRFTRSIRSHSIPSLHASANASSAASSLSCSNSLTRDKVASVMNFPSTRMFYASSQIHVSTCSTTRLRSSSFHAADCASYCASLCIMST